MEGEIGHVIGANLHAWGPLGYKRFLRKVNRSGAKLTLYEYRWPIQDWGQLVEVAHFTADKKGTDISNPSSTLRLCHPRERARNIPRASEGPAYDAA